MNNFNALFKREFFAYFNSPVAYVFIVIFLIASTGFTFLIGSFYQSNQASLDIFFIYHPWIYLVLVPAIGMRLWAEERKSGSIELLFTLPIKTEEAVLAKFFAGWLFLIISLILTFPVVLTVNYLGDPDNYVILSGYFASMLMGGAYLSITSLTSSLTKNQVISFTISVILCFILVLLGWGMFAGMLKSLFPMWFVDIITSLGFINHFQNMSKGLLDSRDLIYFISIIAVALSMNTIILNNLKK